MQDVDNITFCPCYYIHAVLTPHCATGAIRPGLDRDISCLEHLLDCQNINVHANNDMQHIR